MRRLVGLALLLWLAGAAAPAQEADDVLYLQDGRERVGELLRVTAEEIVFRVAGEEQPRTFARAEVQRVELSRERAGEQAGAVEELDDVLLQRLVAEQPAGHMYPDSGYVVLYRLYDCTLEEDGSYTLRERCVEKVLRERGKRRANVARYFLKGEETLEIDFARTINPDGSVTPISDAAVDISSYYAGKPVYERLHQAKFAMKQVKEGSILDYQITKRRVAGAANDLLLPFHVSLLFRGEEPIREAELRIDLSRAGELLHREDRLGNNVEFTQEESGDRVIYRFVARDCPRVVPESLMPPAGDLYPRVTAGLKASWEAIGAAYAEALQDSAAPSEEIKSKVAELTADVGDVEERARRVYHYFIEAVRQVSVPPNDYSYVPHPVAEVFTRRSGNSIDKAALLSVMLGEAGVPAGVVLVCPQSSGKLVEDVPSIRQFDDALVAVTLPSGREFLAVGDESVRFGQMPASYQGARGLLVTKEGSELVTIPLKAPEDEGVVANYRLRVMPNGDLVVSKTQEFFGNDEISSRAVWKDLKAEELRRQLEVALTGMYAKARLGDYSVENLTDVTQPLRFTQDYTLVDYAMRAGDDLLVFQLPEINYGAASVGKPTREFPLKWWRRSRTTKAMTIEVPPGFRVYYAGKDYAADCAVSAFTATFAAAGPEIQYQDEFVQRGLEASREAYGDYKDCIETRARVSKEWIVLERVTE